MKNERKCHVVAISFSIMLIRKKEQMEEIVAICYCTEKFAITTSRFILVLMTTFLSLSLL